MLLGPQKRPFTEKFHVIILVLPHVHDFFAHPFGPNQNPFQHKGIAYRGREKINRAKKSIFFEHLKPPTAIERDPVVLVEEPIKWREL